MNSRNRTKLLLSGLIGIGVVAPYISLPTSLRNFMVLTALLLVLLPSLSDKSCAGGSEGESFRPIHYSSIVVSLIGVLVCVAYARLNFPEFLKVGYDDSFITFRYARNLADFHGLRFNPSDDSNSASSLTFTILLAVFDRLTSMDYLTMANILNLGGLFLLVFQPIRLMARQTSRVQSLVVQVSLACMIATFPPLVYWTFSGMETTFFLGLLVTAISTAVDMCRSGTQESPRKSGGLLVVLSVLSLTRVEGALAAGVIGVALAWNVFSKSGFKALATRNVIGYLTVPTLSLIAQLVFYRLYFSSFISDPIHFKTLVMYYERSATESWNSLCSFILDVGRPIVIVIAFLLLWNLKMWVSGGNPVRGLTPTLAVFASLLLFGLRSPFSDEQRYELMLIAPMIVLLAMLVGNLLERFRASKILSVAAAVLSAGALVGAGLSTQTVQSQIRSRTDLYLYVQKARADAGKWLESNTPSGSRVVSSDIGALSFYNKSNVYLDAAGLVNRTQLSAVRGHRDIYLSMRDQRPEYLVDTVDASGISGVEQILSNPLSYYVADSGVMTSCKSDKVFLKEVIKTFPDVAPAGLKVRISKIVGYLC